MLPSTRLSKEQHYRLNRLAERLVTPERFGPKVAWIAEIKTANSRQATCEHPPQWTRRHGEPRPGSDLFYCGLCLIDLPF